MNSSLIDKTIYSQKHSGKRVYPITRITPHCVVGQAQVENVISYWTTNHLDCSSNYCIGVDGRVALYVDEDNRSWCSSSYDNDNRAVTIECASDNYSPYKFKDVVYDKLIDLCVDICIRNGKDKLIWIADKNTALNYKPKDNEMLLTVHQWFANTSCPGDWLMGRLSELATTVTEKIKTINENKNKETKYWRVQVGAYIDKNNALATEKKLKAKGFDTYLTYY